MQCRTDGGTEGQSLSKCPSQFDCPSRLRPEYLINVKRDHVSSFNEWHSITKDRGSRATRQNMGEFRGRELRGRNVNRNPSKMYDKRVRRLARRRSTLAVIVTNDDERERQRGKRSWKEVESVFAPECSALSSQWRKSGNGIGHGQNNTTSSNQEKREAGTPTFGLIYDMTYLFFSRLLLSLSLLSHLLRQQRTTHNPGLDEASQPVRSR